MNQAMPQTRKHKEKNWDGLLIFGASLQDMDILFQKVCWLGKLEFTSQEWLMRIYPIAKDIEHHLS